MMLLTVEPRDYLKVSILVPIMIWLQPYSAFPRMDYIKVIIGTKSLLGEGWDAPCVNSLILASFVGSSC